MLWSMHSASGRGCVWRSVSPFPEYS